MQMNLHALREMVNSRIMADKQVSTPDDPTETKRESESVESPPAEFEIGTYERLAAKLLNEPESGVAVEGDTGCLDHAEIHVHQRLALSQSCRLRIKHWSVSDAGLSVFTRMP
jgi:hypothetical protein